LNESVNDAAAKTVIEPLKADGVVAAGALDPQAAQVAATVARIAINRARTPLLRGELDDDIRRLDYGDGPHARGETKFIGGFS